MENVIYQKEIFMEHRTEDFHSGIVWYRGHLHLFRLNLSSNGWFAETDLTNEMANGTPIIEHAMHAHQQLKQLKDLWEQLITRNGEGSSSQAPRDAYLGPKESKKKFRDQMTDILIEKLEARTVKGLIYGTPEWKKRFEDTDHQCNLSTNLKNASIYIFIEKLDLFGFNL
ncbi:putative effector protein [Blumeria hordei DH14]|uniref:Putative effector protein n=1 Tax=Blumeria graminis f. sp. hordei (strain DH14) TaxID=546991 RepID=N1JE48_BLUG1|nr:putative effector protein [Blumeria hordei DH14]